MIGSGNLAIGPAFVIQEDYTLKQTPRGHAIAASLIQQNVADRSDRRLQQQDSVQEVDLVQVTFGFPYFCFNLTSKASISYADHGFAEHDVLEN